MAQRSVLVNRTKRFDRLVKPAAGDIDQRQIATGKKPVRIELERAVKARDGLLVVSSQKERVAQRGPRTQVERIELERAPASRDVLDLASGVFEQQPTPQKRRRVVRVD